VDDADLIARLRRGDDAAFGALVTAHQPAMLRLADAFLPSRALAEEATQEAWIGLLRGLDRFEGRASLKTWLYAILVNRARTSGAREHRHLPLDPTDPAVSPDRFDARGAWAEPLTPWESDVDDRVVAESWGPTLRAAVDALPGRQRDVVLLRDVEGLTAEDVCAVLEITEGNQRVLLHRGRSRLRTMLEDELRAGGRS